MGSWDREKLEVQKQGGSDGTAWLLAGGSQHSRKNRDPAVPASPPPHPFPSDVSERGSVTSGIPLLWPRGLFRVLRKEEGSTRSPAACKGQWLVWERGMSPSLPAHGPSAAKNGLKEADSSHLKHSGAFLGARVMHPCKCQPGMGDSKQLRRTVAKKEAKWDRLPGSCSGDMGTAW